MSAEKVRLGLIGTGGFASLHVSNQSKIAESEFAALAEPDPTHAEACKARHPELAELPVYPTHSEMLDEAELDAVIIASPHNVHCEQAVDCLEAGLHVLLQKPMACSIDEARRIMAAEEASGKVLAIGYQRHAYGQFQFIRNAIQSGKAGEVEYISAFQGQNWLVGCTGTWRQKLAVSCGGQLNDSGSHLIDVILWVTDLTPQTVMAQCENFGREVDINSGITVRFTNGAIGNIAVVGNCPVFWEDITITCSKWTFFMRRDKLTYCTGAKGETLELQRTGYGDQWVDANFIDAVLGRDDALAPSVCGLRTIELTEGAWRSAESGMPVTLHNT